MKQETAYKSGIAGKANVYFGGKILVCSGMSDPFDAPAISLSELMEAGVPGGDISPDNKEKAAQVWLTFNNERSIDIMQKHLDNCRKLLQQKTHTALLAEPVKRQDFSNRVLNFFRAHGIEKVADIVRMGRAEMLGWYQFGPKSYNEVNDFIEEHGLQWGMDV